MTSFKALLLFLFLGCSLNLRAQNLPEQECNGAIPVCQSTYSQANSYSGFGLTQELNPTNHGCLNTNERNDVWYVITVSVSGDLAFTITPNSPSDYDFALWNITGGGCQTLYNGLMPVRCDFAGGYDSTGMSNTGLYAFQPVLSVNAGETYLLNVSNFSPTQAGYLLSFAGSTASIFDNQTPRFVSASTTCGVSGDTVKVLMSEAVLCSSIEANGSDFTITPAVPGVSILSAFSPTCTGTSSATLSFNLKLSAPLPNGTYKLKAQAGSDGNTVFDNCSNAQATGDSVIFTIGTPPPPIYNLLRPAQCGRRALYSITPPVAGIYTLTIKQGTTTLNTFSNVSGAKTDTLFPGNYTATLTSAGCNSTVAFTIPPQATTPTLAFAVTPTCTGGAKGTITATPSSTAGVWTYSWNTIPARTGQTITGLAAGTYSVTATNSLGCVLTGSVVVGSVPGFSLGFSHTAPSCYGDANGTATVTASGGTAPYLYLWATQPVQTTPTATGLAAGAYNVLVTDNSGCVANGTALVSQPAALTATSSSTSIPCATAASGIASVTASGGTAPYSYLWSNGATTATVTGLPGGTYTVTITDANNCTATASVQIAVGTGIGGTFTQVSQPQCYGQANGSARFAPTGGTAPYTYAWSNGQTTATATGLAAATYTVAVTDAAGCTRNDTITLSQPAALQASVAAGSVSCFGGANGTATVTVSGGTAPYTYSWNTTPVQTTATATGLASGNYQVRISDARGCKDTLSGDVAGPLAALSVATGVRSATCPGSINGAAYAVVSGGTPPYTYRWNTSPLQTGDTATGLLPRTYTVTVTDDKGCTFRQAVAVPGFALRIAKTAVSCNGRSDASATVTPTGGIAPYTYSWNTQPVQTTATATSLPAGTFTTSVTDANGCTIAANAVITQPTPLAATFTTVPATCGTASNGRATVSVSGSTGSYTYVWNTTPVQTTATATGLASGNYSVRVTDAGGCTDTFSVTVPTGGGISGNFTRKAAPSCFGGSNGSLAFTPTGGAAPYTYLWSNGQTTATATGLAVGSYSILVTDANGCSYRDTTALGEPALLQVSTQGDSTSCFGGANGTATATVTGGTAPYSYSWNTTPVQTTAMATGLISGNYRVTVTDAKGCLQTAQVTIGQPTAITATTGVQRAYCAGTRNGAAYVTAAGGAAPYTYSWNTQPVQTGDTATGLFPGPYTVTITDSKGCVISKTVTVPGFQLATTQTNLLCNGATNGRATVTATAGIAPYTYAWSNGQTTAAISGLSAGNYSVSVTGSDGCILTKNVTITEPAALTATATPTNATCAVAPNGTAVVAAAGGTAPYTYRWNTTPAQTTAAVSGLLPRTYSVTVKDANNCSTTLPVTVLADPGITGTFSQIVSPACLGSANGSATIVPSGGILPYTYRWSNGQTTATATGLTAGNWSVTVTDNAGCSFQDAVTLTQPAALLATTTATNLSCNGGNNGTATVAASGGTAPYTYHWNTTPAQTTATARGLVSGNYTATVTDAKGCVQTTNVTVNQPTALAVTATGTNVLCRGGADGAASVTATGGTPPYTYSWNTTPAQTTAAISGLTARTYRVTVTDANRCTQTTQLTLTQPAAVLSLRTSQTMVSCNGGSNGTATVTASGGTAPYTYAWSNGQTTPTASSLLAGNYSVTVTDANGCTHSATATVTEPTALAATGVQTDISCNGGTNGTATVAVSGGTAPYAYSWNTTPVLHTTTIRNLTAGAYQATVTDAKGCRAVYNFNITQPAPLTVTTGAQNAICTGISNGKAFAVPVGGTAPYSYVWNTSPTQSTDTARGLSAGIYSVTITDSKGCRASQSVSVKASPGVQAAINIIQTPCTGTTDGELAGTATGGTAPYSWSWSTLPAQTTQTIGNLAAGPYTLIVTDSNLCADTAVVNLPLLPLPTVAAGGDKTVCVGQPVVLNGSGTAIRWQWSPSTALNCDTCLKPTSSATNDQWYILTGTGANGCQNRDSVWVKVIQRTPVSVGEIQRICEGETANLTARGGTQYVWSPAATLNSNTVANPVARPDTTTTYQVIIHQGTCFKDTLRQQVEVYKQPVIALPDHLSALYGTKVRLPAQVQHGPFLEWTPFENLDCNACPAPLATITGTTTFVLRASNPGGCATTDSVTVHTDCDVKNYFMPTAFAPEGVDEVRWFYPRSKDPGTIRSLRIFNRWGTQVFERSQVLLNTPHSGWDGYYGGQIAPQGVYVYMLEVECTGGQTLKITGNVTLLQ